MKNKILTFIICTSVLNCTAQTLKQFENKKGLFGFKDSLGKIVVKAEYNYVGEYNCGLARVNKGWSYNAETDERHVGKYGFINKKGKLVVPLIYDGGDDFVNDFAAVKLGNKWGFINTKGDIITPEFYNTVGEFSEGMACVVGNNGNHGFVDTLGKLVIPMKYPLSSYDLNSDYHNKLPAFHFGLALVKLNDMYGYIDKQGKEIIPFENQSAENFSEGVAAMRKGTEVTKYKLMGGEYFRTIVNKKTTGKFGFLNTEGKEQIAFKYIHAGSFYEGLASVSIIDAEGFEKYGYIDKAGNTVIPFIYTDSDSFRNGAAYVVLNGREMYINISGQEVDKPIKIH